MAVEELWCQGYSEPGAGSDLANVQTKARLDGDEWVIDGQKVWTSLAHVADWCFVVVPHRARLASGTTACPSCWCPMDQDGVEVRPIEQLTGGSEFNEVFFTGARTDADLVVGEPGDGWKVAMGCSASSAASRRSASRSASAASSTACVDARRGRTARSTTRCCATGWPGLEVELEVMRLNALRGLLGPSDPAPRRPSISKLVWAELAPRPRRARDGRRRRRPG